MMSSVAWVPWNVLPDSGFAVEPGAVADGKVRLVPIPDGKNTCKNFQVGTAFRFEGADARNDLFRQLKKASDISDPEAWARIDDACTYSDGEAATDLASIPPFMRWFVNTYGCHTLAAILHDQLIDGSGPNKGKLQSDTLSDRFFRKMLEAVGMPFFKRWIIWTAVALRSRWAVGGWRRVSVVLWGILSAAGLGAFVASLVQLTRSHDLVGVPAWTVLIASLAAPLVAMLLWGKQRGAALVAAAAVPWILPPAAFAAAGYAVYWVLERGFSLVTAVAVHPRLQAPTGSAPATPTTS